MAEGALGRTILSFGLAVAFLFCLPSLLPILAAVLLAPVGSMGAAASVEWAVSLSHGLAVAVIAGVGGAWAAVAAQYSTQAPWRTLSLWLVLAAIVPLALLAQCLALALSLVGGAGRSAALFVGHLLSVIPITFVLMLRRVALDGDTHYLALRNFGASAVRAHMLLIWRRYRNEVVLGVVLALFAIFNESAIAGSLGGRTAYFGAVMNAAAFGSADPSTTIVGGLVEFVSIAVVTLLGLAVAGRRT